MLQNILPHINLLQEREKNALIAAAHSSSICFREINGVNGLRIVSCYKETKLEHGRLFFVCYY